jgi:hypothetical protein
MSNSEKPGLARAHVIVLAGVLAAVPGAASPARQEAAEAAPASRPAHQFVHIVYFNPADRECLPGYQERIDRLMSDIQAWYRDEMARNGFGPLTFPLERDRGGRLVIHVVTGDRTYARNEQMGTHEIRDNQVKPALRAEGIDVDREHIIIFQNLLFVEHKPGEKLIRAWCPYCGGGNHASGTAWVTDFELLDPLNLPRKEPKIDDNGRPRTLGNYMVAQIGGVAHEFGHSLGLPHNEQTAEQFERLGYTLMGRGNYHLFGKRAGEEKDAYLSAPHAMILSSHPLFKRSAKNVDVEADCEFRDIEFAAGDGEYIVSGRVEATPEPYALVAYHDLMQHHLDYDATSWVSPIDPDGRFQVRVGALEPGRYELRLRCYMVNGDRDERIFRFDLGPELKIPVGALQRQALYELHARPAIAARDPATLRAAIAKLADFNDIHYRRARAWERVLTHRESDPRELGTVDSDVREVPLSSIKWKAARVGWEQPSRNCVSDGRPLESGEQFHETGLYAHADSSYVYDLDGQWARFRSAYGLQNLNEGSVVFVVKCDGAERFRSTLLKDWVEGLVNVDLTGVEQLELIVEDGGDGKWGDCGIWFSPMLVR